MSNLMVKDPDSVLDFAFDWKASTNGTGSSDWLASGESISSYTIDADAGITVDSDAQSGGVVTVWLSGGTAGTAYAVRCEIVTSAGRTDERTIHIHVRER